MYDGMGKDDGDDGKMMNCMMELYDLDDGMGKLHDLGSLRDTRVGV